MDLEFDGASARGLRRYVTLVAEALGLTGHAWTIQLEPPTSVYLALEQRLPEFPTRDAALLWDEHNGWSMAVETHGTEDLLVVAYLGVDLLPAPRLVAQFADALIEGNQSAGLAEPPRRRPFDDDLPERLAAYARPRRATDPRRAPLTPPEPGTISVRVRREEGAVVLQVVGEIDMITEPALLKSVTRALDQHPAVLVVDLSQVTFFGSAGLHVLAQAQHDGACHTRIRVVAAAPGTLRPIQVTGMDSELEIYATLRQAVTAAIPRTPPAHPPRTAG